MIRPVTALASLILGVVLLTGCTADPTPDEAESPMPTPSLELPSEGEIADHLGVSCADIIPADLARTLNTGGFEAGEPQPWPVDEPTFADGQICEWTDGTSEPALFGWAQATAAEAEAARRHLTDRGWATEDRDGLDAIVDPDTGAAYVFGSDDTVKFASTLDGAVAVIVPSPE
ncbi:hypothetical protein [Microbacterium alcoholitolerans]|uniref:hypothetical protein n=1 Tax=unclassified Microbacterium TaxID=2609290 RepID=UPI003D18246D